MSGLNAATLLAAWERALPQSPVQRGLTLLATAWPEKSVEQWANVSIGERDGYLLRLRDEVFGCDLEGTTVCPMCRERLHLTFGSDAIRAQVLQASTGKSSLRLEASGYELDYRLPTSADLIEVAAAADSNGREVLLRRCVTASRGGARIDPVSLPTQIVSAVTEGMTQADPQAEIRIDLTCPACPHHWSTIFDILSYLWSEIDDWAQRLLLEVHALASAYGWGEGEIIAMSARRRHLYLGMLGA
ncbi:MAG TPA: hypothetical protein VNG71_21340 [Pyrinomonadaceae bacterium]|nr:hypothetical protein [Pyrinomonadaceae bacterium]